MTTNLDLVLGRARNVIPTREAVRLLQQQSPSVTNNQEPTSIASTSWVDSAERVTDREAVFMARYMVRHEGLFLGSSSCVNLVAAVKMARKLSSNVDKDYDDETTWPRIVTMLCDAGTRHLTKFWSDEYIVKHGVFSSEELASLSLDNLDFIK